MKMRSRPVEFEDALKVLRFAWYLGAPDARQAVVLWLLETLAYTVFVDNWKKIDYDSILMHALRCHIDYLARLIYEPAGHQTHKMREEAWQVLKGLRLTHITIISNIWSKPKPTQYWLEKILRYAKENNLLNVKGV